MYIGVCWCNSLTMVVCVYWCVLVFECCYEGVFILVCLGETVLYDGVYMCMLVCVGV